MESKSEINDIKMSIIQDSKVIKHKSFKKLNLNIRRLKFNLKKKKKKKKRLKY